MRFALTIAFAAAIAGAGAVGSGFVARGSVAAPDEAKPRDLDTRHLFTPASSRKAWEERASAIRRQILFSAGLLPMPEKTPLHPRVTGRIEADDYTIENVALETR